MTSKSRLLLFALAILCAAAPAAWAAETIALPPATAGNYDLGSGLVLKTSPLRITIDEHVYDANTVLVLPMTEADAGYQDYSSNSLTVNTFGGVHTELSNTPVGDASAKFSVVYSYGTGTPDTIDRVSIPGSSIINSVFAGTEWTLECWFATDLPDTGNSKIQTLFGIAPDGRVGLRYDDFGNSCHGGLNIIALKSNCTTTLQECGTKNNYGAGQFYHVALSLWNGTVNLWVDGELDAALVFNDIVCQDPHDSLEFGIWKNLTSFPLRGNLGGCKLSDTARYTAQFERPSNLGGMVVNSPVAEQKDWTVCPGHANITGANMEAVCEPGGSVDFGFHNGNAWSPWYATAGLLSNAVAGPVSDPTQCFRARYRLNSDGSGNCEVILPDNSVAVTNAIVGEGDTYITYTLPLEPVDISTEYEVIQL